MKRRLEFDFEWRITLFTVLLLPLLITLGFWQLEREDEKRALAAAFERQQSMPPAPLSALDGQAPETLAYRPVRLEGRYLAGRDLLLDNRTREGRFGNEALTLFRLGSGELALVNRGWLPADPSRLELPAVPLVDDEVVEITGQVYVSPGKPYLLADEALPEGWPKRVQAVEMAKLAASLGEPLFPYPVRIDAGEVGALQVDWRVLNVSPAKHRGYAVQWFTMAAVLALIYLIRSAAYQVNQCQYGGHGKPLYGVSPVFRGRYVQDPPVHLQGSHFARVNPHGVGEQGLTQAGSQLGHLNRLHPFRPPLRQRLVGEQVGLTRGDVYLPGDLHDLVVDQRYSR